MCGYLCMCVCVCVCVRAHACMCAHIYALRIVSTDTILCHINALIIIITSCTVMFEPLLMCTLCDSCLLNCGRPDITAPVDWA